MGLDASIKPLKGDSLGTAKDVASILAEHFPGLALIRHPRPVIEGPRLLSFLDKVLPKSMTWKVTGPTAEYNYSGDFQGDGWSTTITFDDSPNVPEVFLVMYGSRMELSEPYFARLFKAHEWTLSFD